MLLQGSFLEEAMASTLVVMASNLRAIASKMLRKTFTIFVLLAEALWLLQGALDFIKHTRRPEHGMWADVGVSKGI